MSETNVGNDIYKKFKENQEIINKKRKKVDLIFNILICIFISMVIISSLNENNSNIFYSKLAVQKNIKKAILNNADINTLENVLGNSVKIFKIKEKNNEYYSHSISLENILKDIQVENYLSDEFDQKLNDKISDYIKEYKKVNPLGELSNNQKEYFINIKNKLDDNSYLEIENDLNKIVGELSNKNKLVEIYLDNSDISFKLTMLSFILGLIALFPLLKSFMNFLIIKFIKLD